MNDLERLLRVVLDGQSFLYASMLSIQKQISTGQPVTSEEFDLFRDEWASETQKELEMLKAASENSGTIWPATK